MKQRTESRNHLARLLLGLLLVACMAIPSLSGPRNPRGRVGSASPQSDAGEKAIGPGVAIVGLNSVEMRKFAEVTGDVVVNDTSAGPYLNGVQLSLDKVTILGDIKAADIDIANNAEVENVCVDNLTDAGADINGTVGSYSNSDPAPCDATPPIFDPLPQFNTGVGGSPDVIVPSNSTDTIGAGRVGDIVIGKNSTLFVTGGLVEASSVTMENNAELLFQSATDMRVEGIFDVTKAGTVGPNAGSGIGASDIIIYVSAPSSDPSEQVAIIGENSDASANFYVLNGTFALGKGADMVGAVVALDVQLGTSASLVVDSFFVNQPPVGDAKTVFTIDDAALEITMSGSDPDNDELTFSIAIPPTKGTLGAITPIVPAQIPVIDRVTGMPIPGEFFQPPVTSATVTYTPTDPTPPLDELDGFTFQVADPDGLVGLAVIDINPNDPTPPDDPQAVLDALAQFVETAVATPATIILAADSPEDPPGSGQPAPVTFSVISLPAGTLQDEFGTPIETVPFPLLSAKVIYAPPATGSSDTFDFQADATVGGLPQTDTATVDITINEPAELGVDLTLSTDMGQPVEVLLLSSPGGISGLGGAPLSIAKAFPGATIAGRTSSTGGSTGDGSDPLPGPVPLLVGAGVDIVGDLSTSSLVTDPTGDTDPELVWTLNSITFDPAKGGGSASGSFVFNHSTGFATDWNISTAGGDTVNFSPFNYVPGPGTTDTQFTGNNSQFQFVTNGNVTPPTGSPRSRSLRFTMLDPLTSAGGVAQIDQPTGAGVFGSTECFNCSPFRDIVTGDLSAVPHPDLVSATLSSDGIDLTVDVRFDPATFDPNTTGAKVLIDTDQNAATGCDPGETTSFPCAASSSTDSIGWEFWVQIPEPASPSTSGNARVLDHTDIGTLTLVPFTTEADGFTMSIPLSDLGGDNGQVNFRVFSFRHAAPPGAANPNTGPVDFLPDLGSQHGTTSPHVEGTARLQIEFDMTSVPSVSDDLDQATVVFNTEIGATDTLDTLFFVGTSNQDGLLTPSDFESASDSIPNVVMPAPTGAVGQPGTFAFDVTPELKSAIDGGFGFFSIQGQVDEQQSGPQTGLQIQSSADGNVIVGIEPQLLVITTTQASPDPLEFEIVSLPLASEGVLSFNGVAVTLGQTFTVAPTLLFTPNPLFSGLVLFNYSVTEDLITDVASVSITVTTTDPCVIVGREPGCTP
jgi:hypothetical protein